MKIGLLGIEDPADVRSFSGTPFHLAHFLRAAGHEVRILGPYPLRFRALVRLQNRLVTAISGHQLVWQRHKLIAGQYPGIVQHYASEHPDLDVLLATSGFYIAKAQAHIPLVFWGDTTVAGVIDTYAQYKRLSPDTVDQCHAVEQNGLDACDLAIFSNQWAADIAVKAYTLDTRKIRVITYGANLLEIPDSIEMGQLIAARSQAEIRFVHVGLDWIRKGVDRAIETVGDLRTRGLNTTLQIVGSEVPSDTSIPDFVSLAGKLPKSTNAGRARMSQILGESHVLILPTLAECAAVVLAEAGAFGVPVLASDVGGNASLVRQNVNGILLSPQATTAEWADAALRIVADRQTYERWAWQSFDFFRQELSWTRSVSRFAEEIRKMLERDDRSFIHTGATS